MSEQETTYCRFCAQRKPYGKLVNLDTDVERKQIVTEKLSRLSLAVINLNSPHDALPKTVCFPCMESLDKAIEFVSNVESAQSELSAFGLVTIKHEVDEVLDEDANQIHEEKYSKQDVKIEVEIGDEVKYDPGINTDEKTQKENCNAERADNKVEEKSSDKKDLVKSVLPDSEVSWKDYSWLCAYCDVMFSSINELKEHAMQSHGCCNPYRCTDCKIRKLNLDGFIKHVNCHRKHLKLSCYKCHQIFYRQYDAIMHRKEHFNTEFRCPGCNETFATKEKSFEHCNMYNKDKKIREVPAEQLTDDLRCVFCHKQFRYKGGLTTHLLTQHREKKRDHTCDKCGKCFLNKANLAGHMMMHDNIRPYECEICQHRFRQRSQLSRHMGTHDGKKPFACEQCGRRFRLKKQLNTHSIVHTDKFPHICLYCKKGFKHKSTFIQHERQHTGERPYKCQICDRDFTNWPNYNKHMKRLHGMNMAKSQQLSTNSTTAEVKNNFVPKRRGRPKLIKSKVKTETL